MKRFFAIGVLLVAFALPTAAAADPPDREPAPFESFTTTACGFEVLIEPVQQHFWVMTFPEGRVVEEIDGGSAVIRLSSGTASIQLNISGPAFLKQAPDGTMVFSGAGPWLFFDHPFVNLPPVAYITGRITFDDEEPIINVTGRVVDVCALLS
jgi:hypothetical protein